MALLTNMAVEEKVIRRVRRKAQTFGQDVQDADMPAAQPDASSLKLDPEHIVKLYHDFIIPLTKEAEVAYLMQRLGNTRVAFQGAADGSCYHLAVQHFDHMARAMPETMCYHSGCIACHLPGIDRCHWLRMFDDMNGLLVSSASQASGLLPCESSLGVFEALMSNRAFLGLVVLEKADSGILPATRALLGDYPLKVSAQLTSKGTAGPQLPRRCRAGEASQRSHLLLLHGCRSWESSSTRLRTVWFPSFRCVMFGVSAVALRRSAPAGAGCVSTLFPRASWSRRKTLMLRGPGGNLESMVARQWKLVWQASRP